MSEFGIVEAQGFRLPFRPLARLAQDEELECPGREARSGGGLGQDEEVMNSDQHRDIYNIFAAAIVFVFVATVFALWVAWR
jgi:hypothetical protein